MGSCVTEQNQLGSDRTHNQQSRNNTIMSSLDVYMKESGEIVARLGFMSEEYSWFSSPIPGPGGSRTWTEPPRTRSGGRRPPSGGGTAAGDLHRPHVTSLRRLPHQALCIYILYILYNFRSL